VLGPIDRAAISLIRGLDCQVKVELSQDRVVRCTNEDQLADTEMNWGDPCWLD
jgi:hypothetical protein